MNIDPDLANVVGFFDMACIIGAYACRTIICVPDDQRAAEPVRAARHQLLGTALLTVSLLAHSNLPRSCWRFLGGITVFGLGKPLVNGGRSESRA